MLFAVLILDLISEKFITEKGWDCVDMWVRVRMCLCVCTHTHIDWLSRHDKGQICTERPTGTASGSWLKADSSPDSSGPHLRGAKSLGLCFFHKLISVSASA